MRLQIDVLHTGTRALCRAWIAKLGGESPYSSGIKKIMDHEAEQFMIRYEKKVDAYQDFH